MDEEAYRQEVRLRRLATQVICLLPEDPFEAIAVLAYAQTLMTDFVMPAGPRPERPPAVVEEGNVCRLTPRS